MAGWICIYRSIRDHWIWDDPRLKWWLDILLTVNHEPKDVPIRGRMYHCGVGQSVMSIRSWAKMWRTSHYNVMRFFSTLKSCGMINVENLHTTTRITVCNYESYQNMRTNDAPQNAPQINHKPHHFNGCVSDCYEDMRTTDAPQNAPQTAHKQQYNKNTHTNKESEFLKFCEWVAKEAPHVAMFRRQMTERQWDKLRENHTKKEITDVILEIENKQENWSRYTSVNTTVRSFLKYKK